MMLQSGRRFSGMVAATVFAGLAAAGCSGDGLKDLEAVPTQDVVTTDSSTPQASPSNEVPTIGEDAQVVPEVPGAPTNVQVGSWDRAEIVTLGWSAPYESGSSAVLSYHISYLEPGSSTWADLMDVDAVTGQDQYWQDIRVATFGAYSFRVTATNAVGASPAGELLGVQLD